MMTFGSLDRMWINTLGRINMYGETLDSRAGPSWELVGFSAQLTNVDRTFLLNVRRKLSPFYACAELLWYLSGVNHVNMLKAYAPQYANFTENGVSYGAYGYRLFSNLCGRDASGYLDEKHRMTGHNTDQIDVLIHHLLNDRNSRQAVVTFWEANDLAHACKKDHKDLPCTLSLQFLLRDGRLHLVATMRSNDVWLGMPYDVFTFTCIQRLVASALDVECGTYTHQAGSMHLYKKNAQGAKEAMRTPYHGNLKHDWGYTRAPDWRVQRYGAVLAEERYRLDDNVGGGVLLETVTNQMLHDVVACCAAKWGKRVQIYSPMLQEALCSSSKDQT